MTGLLTLSALEVGFESWSLPCKLRRVTATSIGCSAGVVYVQPVIGHAMAGMVDEANPDYDLKIFQRICTDKMDPESIDLQVKQHTWTTIW